MRHVAFGDLEPDGPTGRWLARRAKQGGYAAPLAYTASAGVPPKTAKLQTRRPHGDLVEPVPLDIDLLPRFVDDLLVADTGSGTPPLVDLGAYEKQ